MYAQCPGVAGNICWVFFANVCVCVNTRARTYECACQCVHVYVSSCTVDQSQASICALACLRT